MKLSLIAAGMLAAVSGTALAASNVTLYGILGRRRHRQQTAQRFYFGEHVQRQLAWQPLGH